MRNRLARTLIATFAVAGLVGLAAPAAQAAPPKPKKYANCAALNKVYQHGVARKGAKDKVKGSTKPVTTFTVYTKVYDLNKAKLDRDKDGVACEKR
jgi:hypothetical protein